MPGVDSRSRPPTPITCLSCGKTYTTYSHSCLKPQ